MKGTHKALLTIRNVPTLAIGTWWDRALPGFYLAVHPPGARYPQGVRSFGVWYRVRGRSRQKRLGRFPTVGLAAARARAREILEAARLRGVDLGAASRALSLVGMVEAFLVVARAERPRTRADSTIAGYEQMVRADLRSAREAAIPLEELHRRDVEAMLRKVAARAPVTARRLLQLLVVASRWAVHEEMIDHDPTFGVKRLAAEPSRERVLRDDEIVLLWRAAVEDAAATMTRNGPGRSRRQRKDAEIEAAVQRSALARFLLLTAQRTGETTAMEWPELDAAGKLWHIPAEHRKGQRGKRRAHVVPVSTAAAAVLAELRADWVPGRVFPWALSNHRHWIDPIRNRARSLGLVEHWTPHDLRRTAASGMARLGTTRSVIAMILGHTLQEGGAVTGVYDRFDRMPERAAALEAWGAYVTALIANARSG